MEISGQNGIETPGENGNFPAGESNRSEDRISRHVIHSVLAHDLKGFVGNMVILLDLILKDKEIDDINEHFDMLSKLRSSAVSVNALLDNFLFWVKIKNYDFSLKPHRVNITRMLTENVSIFSHFAENKSIMVKLDAPDECYARGDEYLLNTVVRNLMYNALKFTDTGGIIRVSAMPQGEHVLISVEDNGIGMSREEIALLFDPQRTFSTTGTWNEQGSGLGLILSKEFIEKNGGRLSVESHKSQGSIFRFTVPAQTN